MEIPFSERNVKKENLWQYQPPPGEIIVSFNADVRRMLYLKYGVKPEAAEAGEKPRNIWDEMAQRLDDFKGLDIADIGTGASAYMITTLLKRGHRGNLIGFDTSSSSFDVMEEALRNEYQHPDIWLRHGDAQALPLDENSVDAAIAPFLVYHLPRPRKLFDEMKRIIKPGGLAIISGRDIDNTRNLWHVAGMVAKANGAIMSGQRRNASLMGPTAESFYWHFPLDMLHQSINSRKHYEIVEYEIQDEDLYIPADDEGWNDFREAVFSLLPMMRKKNGSHPTKSEVLPFLEQNKDFNVRRNIFESLAAEFGGYFPDHLQQGFVVAKIIK